MHVLISSLSLFALRTCIASVHAFRCILDIVQHVEYEHDMVIN